MLYFLIVFLHKSVGAKERVCHYLWSYGWNCGGNQYFVDCLLCLGEESETFNASLANV